MPKITTDARIEKLRKEYAKDYDLDSLNSSNDRANLEQLLRLTIAGEDLANEMNKLIEAGASGNVQDIVKLSGAIDTISTKCLALEKQLGIDRKTRKTENNVESPAEYIAKLKIYAKEFLEKRITRVYCEDCKVMIFRFAPVHDHTKFELKCTCSQCGKVTRIHRDAKGIFFDLPAKDRAWREKYTYEVEMPKANATDIDIEDTEDDMILGGSDGN